MEGRMPKASIAVPHPLVRKHYITVRGVTFYIWEKLDNHPKVSTDGAHFVPVRGLEAHLKFLEAWCSQVCRSDLGLESTTDLIVFRMMRQPLLVDHWEEVLDILTEDRLEQLCTCDLIIADLTPRQQYGLARTFLLSRPAIIERDCLQILNNHHLRDMLKHTPWFLDILSCLPDEIVLCHKFITNTKTYLFATIGTEIVNRLKNQQAAISYFSTPDVDQLRIFMVELCTVYYTLTTCDTEILQLQNLAMALRETIPLSMWLHKNFGLTVFEMAHCDCAVTMENNTYPLYAPVIATHEQRDLFSRIFSPRIPKNAAP